MPTYCLLTCRSLQNDLRTKATDQFIVNFSEMGRAKLNMELITNDKARNITFKKRKEGLIRKMHEFTTLCDVKACMIMYGGPKQEQEHWPQNIDEVRQIIDIYKSKNKDSCNKAFGLPDFFHGRKRKIEEELAKLRKKNMEAKYPTWLDFMNSMTVSQLREFAVALQGKAEYVRSKIETLKRNKEVMDMNLMDFGNARLSHHHQSHSFYASPSLIVNQHAVSSLRPFEMQVPVQHHQFPSVDHHSVNQNSMIMLLMNENHEQNVQCASYKRQVFYEAMADPTMCPRPLRYYEPPPYMQAP